MNNDKKQKSNKLAYIGIALGSANLILLTILLILLLKGQKTEDTSASAQGDEASRVEALATGDVSSSQSERPDDKSLAETVKADKEEPDTPQATASATCPYAVTYQIGNQWENGSTHMYGLEIKLENRGDAIQGGWTLNLEIDGLVEVQGWDGIYTATGNTLHIENAEHNQDFPSGGLLFIGCNLGSDDELHIQRATLNGVPCDLIAGAVDRNAAQSDNKSDSKHDNNSEKTQSKPLPAQASAVTGDDWLHTDGNRILDQDGKEVWLTGVNWFGYNTGTNTFDGLWNSKMVPTVEEIANHGFNLIRVPISARLINQWASGEYPRANYNNAYNPEMNSMNSLEIFDYFLRLAEENGIKVMPDIHSAETDAGGHNVNLWYTAKVSAEDYYSALEWLAERYKDNDTIIAYDLKNEPHGKPNEGKSAAIWNDSEDANNWKYVAETAAARILNKNPNVLILVEGTEIYPRQPGGDYSSTNSADYYFNWWGGNLRGVAEYPIDLGSYQDKLVYSPHDYGPTVYEQPWFQGDYTYDSLMKDCWQENWFYIHKENKAPLLIGEWGGFMREPNLKWMTYLRKLIATYHLNHTFWCLNANSGDTGGLLLDDFTTWDTEKYNFVKEVLWQENGKFVGLDHVIPLGKNGITTTDATGF